MAEVPTGGQLVWGPGYSHGSVGGQLTLITWQSLKLRTPSKSQRHDFRWGDGLTAQQGPNSHGTRAGCLSDTSSPPLKRLRVSFLIWKAGLWGQAGALPCPGPQPSPLHPQVFKSRTPPEAIALCSSLLEYTPSSRLSPLEACAHSFFDELRCPGTQLPNNRPLPPLFNFSPGGESPAWDLGCWRGSRRQ